MSGSVQTPPGLSLRYALVWSFWAAVLAALCGGLLAYLSGARGDVAPLTLPGLIAVTGAMTFGVISIMRWIGRFAPEPVAVALTLTLVVLLAAAPVWLGTLAEFTGSMAVANTAVAISPLSALSVCVDYDYLRNLWFYEHAAIGSLRYDYPPPALIAAAWLLPAVATRGVTRALIPPHKEPDRHESCLR